MSAERQVAFANPGGVADFHPLSGAVQQAERDGIVAFPRILRVLGDDLSGQGLDELELEMLPVPSGTEGRVDTLEYCAFRAALAQDAESFALLLDREPGLDRANVAQPPVAFDSRQNGEQLREAKPVGLRSEVAVSLFKRSKINTFLETTMFRNSLCIQKSFTAYVRSQLHKGPIDKKYKRFWKFFFKAFIPLLEVRYLNGLLAEYIAMTPSKSLTANSGGKGTSESSLMLVMKPFSIS